MKTVFVILFLFTGFPSIANMAEPVERGTLGGRPFTSQFVDILHENLAVKIDENFEYAMFDIEYHISASKDGIRIPLLFYASELTNDFKVSIDGKVLEILEVPAQYKAYENSKFKDFQYFFQQPTFDHFNPVLIETTKNEGFYVNLLNMKYFETDILAGKHIISVSYKATHWKDKSDWVNQYSFRYALSPAKYWKSFGTLTLTVDATDFDNKINSNVNKPNKGDLNNKAIWKFDELPVEVLHLTYTPKVNAKVSALINIGPSGLAISLIVILFVIHLAITAFYRKRNPRKGHFLIIILGSLIIPFIFVISWMYFYSFIDFVIGKHAGRHHGYTFFIIVWYPIIIPTYFLIFWSVDKIVKRKYGNYKLNQHT